MSGNGLLAKTAILCSRVIATPWANHMAYTMGVEEKDNLAGKVIMKVGLFISRIAGRNL